MEHKMNKRILLALLWTFLSLNYILCDVLSNMEAATLQSLLVGEVAGMKLTQGFILMAGISLEIPFLMVVLSYVLPYKFNRRLQWGAATLMIIYQLGSFFIGSDSTMHYIFFSAVEVLANIIIIAIAFKWKEGPVDL